MSNTGVLSPMFGMWMSTAVLLPFSVFLTYKAAKDSTLFDATSYEKLFRKLFKKKKSDESTTAMS